jgi:hypothetical protein
MRSFSLEAIGLCADYGIRGKMIKPEDEMGRACNTNGGDEECI